MQHAHSAEMADDMHVRDTLRGGFERNRALVVSSFPRAQRASAWDQTALTLVQVS